MMVRAATTSVLALVLVGLAAPGLGRSAAPDVAEPALAPQVQVTLGQSEASVGVGDRLGIEARIVNTGGRASGPLVAHLNVATLDSSVYVDLEDWTASPTKEVAPLPPGGSTTLRWVIQAVNVGHFDVYVVVMPRVGPPADRTPLIASPPELVHVAGRRTVSAGGALPVVLMVPMLIAIVAVLTRYRPWQRR